MTIARHPVTVPPAGPARWRFSGMIILLAAAGCTGPGFDVVDTPRTDTVNAHYVANRPPLAPNPLLKLPIRSIEPQGWLRRQLELQAEGFHGHLTGISRFLVKEGNAWLSPAGEGDHGWEEPPYWLKGYGNLACLLRDEAMLAETRIWIEGALASRKPDGWFGPDRGRTGAATRLTGREDLWPNMIMLFCLQDWYDFTGDERVIELMTAYFDYLKGVPEEEFLLGYWPRMRGGDLLFSVYWLYNRTGDAELLDLAGKVHRRTADWTSGVTDWHNVNMSQAFGQPTTYWMQSQDPAHLEASYSNFATIREMYGQVPGGMFAGDENCRPGHTDPRQAVETCGMVEMMLSTETLLWITGDPLWADRCEDVAFNSLPAALTADLKALRYLTGPNLVLSDSESKSPGLQNGGPMLQMNPHIHRCCQHNWGHGWPYFAEHLWFATPDNGLAAAFFCASRVTAMVGGNGTDGDAREGIRPETQGDPGEEITITLDTHYPFSEEMTFTVETAAPAGVAFPLYLRIPTWTDEAVVEVEGGSSRVRDAAGRWVLIERTWHDGDRVDLTLPMEVSLRTWTENHNAVSVDRGPLTYSLQIGEEYRRSGGTDEWPAWDIHPTTAWNYGLQLRSGDPTRSFEVEERAWPADDMPFTHDGTPIRLHARGRRIPEWQLDMFGLAGMLQPSPVTSDESEEELTLIPMGAARLRVSSFPLIGSGPEAHRWDVPPEPDFQARASHCYSGDTVLALADGLEPQNSDDHSIPRMTWWPHQGTGEWVEIEFDEETRLSRLAVYWFDDEPRGGGCRPPASWRLFYRTCNEWRPVETTDAFGVEKDRYNEVTFTPVDTRAVRIEVRLLEGFSGGILEVRTDR